MTDTKTLIASLSNDARMQPAYSPSYWGVRLIAVLMLYAIATQTVLGIHMTAPALDVGVKAILHLPLKKPFL